MQSLLENSRKERKKQIVKPLWQGEFVQAFVDDQDVLVLAENACDGCLQMNEEIIHLRKRLEQLEELLPTVKEFPLKHSYVINISIINL